MEEISFDTMEAVVEIMNLMAKKETMQDTELEEIHC